MKNHWKWMELCWNHPSHVETCQEWVMWCWTHPLHWNTKTSRLRSNPPCLLCIGIDKKRMNLSHCMPSIHLLVREQYRKFTLWDTFDAFTLPHFTVTLCCVCGVQLCWLTCHIINDQCWWQPSMSQVVEVPGNCDVTCPDPVTQHQPPPLPRSKRETEGCCK